MNWFSPKEHRFLILISHKTSNFRFCVWKIQHRVQSDIQGEYCKIVHDYSFFGFDGLQPTPSHCGSSTAGHVFDSTAAGWQVIGWIHSISRVQEASASTATNNWLRSPAFWCVTITCSWRAPGSTATACCWQWAFKQYLTKSGNLWWRCLWWWKTSCCVCSLFWVFDSWKKGSGGPQRRGWGPPWLFLFDACCIGLSDVRDWV